MVLFYGQNWIKIKKNWRNINVDKFITVLNEWLPLSNMYVQSFCHQTAKLKKHLNQDWNVGTKISSVFDWRLTNLQYWRYLKGWEIMLISLARKTFNLSRYFCFISPQWEHFPFITNLSLDNKRSRRG